MVIKFTKMDLFKVEDKYRLAHCISADLALGKGIAVEFNNRFNLRVYLNNIRPKPIDEYGDPAANYCIKIGRVYNLITKRYYYNKPTY